jgi:hypothetical protein
VPPARSPRLSKRLKPMAFPKQMEMPDVYFDSTKGNYWMKLTEDRYLNLDERRIGRHLRMAGLDPDEQKGPLKAIERVFYKAELERSVDFAGALAGYKAGMFPRQSGERILVTSEGKPPAGKPGDCSLYDEYLTELLPDDQSRRVIAWLHFARKTLRRGDFMPGQCLVLCGPPRCGKSYLQRLITVMLGGREADPFDYMVGETGFNGEFAGAEHWVIMDKSPTLTTSARRKFGDRLKECIANISFRIHPKGRPAFNMDIYRRMSISINREHQNIMLLPPMDESLRGKFLICKTADKFSGGERPKVLLGNYGENDKRFMAQMPAFCHYVDNFRVPKAWLDESFGVKAWAHTDIMDVLSDVSPEQMLMNYIDDVIFSKDSKWLDVPWMGSATELETELTAVPYLKNRIERLLTFSSACGTYLSNLAAHHPSRFEARKLHGKTKWIIRAP